MNKYYSEQRSEMLKKLWGKKYYLHWNDPDVTLDHCEPKEITIEQRYQAEDLDCIDCDISYNKLIGKVK